MDDLHCNKLTCRRILSDKAVVTTCSHIFCVECANEIFATPTLICAACDTTLDQPDDVVICSLHPTNDYKTSILSGLAPQIILEICSRALSFWQYQIHQENSFQQAVLRNVNDRNAQLQQQLDNVVREANSELSLLTNKVTTYERDLELERRKNRELVESAKEKDADYQKLKARKDDGVSRAPLIASSRPQNQLDKMKRKIMLGPNAFPASGLNANGTDTATSATRLGGGDTAMTNVVNDMEANKIQRTPIRQGMANSSAPFPLSKDSRSRPLQQPSYIAQNLPASTSTPNMNHAQTQHQGVVQQNPFFPPLAQQQQQQQQQNSNRYVHQSTPRHRSVHRDVTGTTSGSESDTGGAGGGFGSRRRHGHGREGSGGASNRHSGQQQDYDSAFLRGPPDPGFVDKQSGGSKRVFAALPPKRQSNGFRPVSLPNS